MISIQIERLKHSVRIFRKDDFDFGPFGSFAEIQDVEFDGYGYTVTALMIDPDYGYATDQEVQFVVDAGGVMDFGGIGEPALRAEDDVSDEEWEAKGEAIGAAIDRLQGLINHRRLQMGQPVTLEAATASFCDMIVSRNVDAQLNRAVANAIGVPAQMAAE